MDARLPFLGVSLINNLIICKSNANHYMRTRLYANQIEIRCIALRNTCTFITAPHSFYCVMIESSLFSLFMDRNDSTFIN